MLIPPIPFWEKKPILPWPPGDPTVIVSHVSGDGGKSYAGRNHLGQYLPKPELETEPENKNPL